jgi:hypothetical protein
MTASQSLAAAAGIEDRQLAGGLPAFAFFAFDGFIGFTHRPDLLEGMPAIHTLIFIDRHM